MRANVRPGRWFALVAVLVVSSGVVGLADEVRPFPKGATIGRSEIVLRYLAQEPIIEDLKLTAEQRERIDRWRQEERDVDRRSTPPLPAQEFLMRMAEDSEKTQATLEEILTPDQIGRFRQHMLQHALILQHGLSGLLQLTEIKDVLRLDFNQQEQIEAMEVNAAAAANERFRANRPQPVPMFANSDLTGRNLDQQEIADELDSQISAVLTADQKNDLLEFLGLPVVGQVTPVFFTLPQPPRPPPGVGPVRMVRPTLVRRPVRRLPDSSMGGEGLSDSSLQMALLTLQSVREELKISDERAQQEVLFCGDGEEMTRSVRRLEQWLETGQLDRLRQLVLQVEFDRRGPGAALVFREVVEALQLTDDQRASLEAFVKSELNSNRHSLEVAVEADPAKRSALERGVTDRLNAILTTVQRNQLTEMAGRPARVAVSLTAVNRALQPRFSVRARTVMALGELKSENLLMLRMAAIQDELELSDEQRAALTDAAYLIRERDQALAILTEQQRKRFTEILLQGEVRRDGPAVLFRYHQVIDALEPDDEQNRKLLEIVQEDTRSYLRIPFDQFAEKLPELDAATAKRLESVLSVEQREKLAGLLGEPSRSIDEPFRPAIRNQK